MLKEDEVKRKLRRIKRQEVRLRYNGNFPGKELLVWSKYFGVSGIYTLESLLEDQKRQDAIADYLYALYMQYFSEQGLLGKTLDPLKLVNFGLPPDATPAQVKGRFRELAKENHPDLGGSHEKMVELIKLYKQLVR